jgi:hypothetical protein
MKTTTIGIIVLTLVVVSLSTFGTTHAHFTSRQVTGPHLISTWQSYFWTQTSQADYQMGALENVDTISSPGDVKLVWKNISPTIYATLGSGSTTFQQYNVSNNTWNSLTNTPGSISNGGAVAKDNLSYLYALRGGGQSNFYRYSIPFNNWSSMTATPAAINSGGALVYSGGNYLYALRGGGQSNFYRYSIPFNNWSSMTATPAAINSGGALVSDNGNYIYAFNGSSQKFWLYNISANTWNDTVVSDPPGSAGWGGSLSYVPGSSGFIPLGTLASQVFDSGNAGSRWDSLFWDTGLVAGTNVTFEVRASDTLFTNTDALPAWQQSGWPSPINSGLPSGRYLQWRATLSTSNSSRTPILNEVRVWYS